MLIDYCFICLISMVFSLITLCPLDTKSRAESTAFRILPIFKLGLY